MGEEGSIQTGHDPDIQSGPPYMGPPLQKSNTGQTTHGQWNQHEVEKRHQHEANKQQDNSNEDQAREQIHKSSSKHVETITNKRWTITT